MLITSNLGMHNNYKQFGNAQKDPQKTFGGFEQIVNVCLRKRCGITCLVSILANTPGGVKRSGLDAPAVGLLVMY